MIPASEALERLREGNRRFVEERPRRPRSDADRREAVETSQAPFAAVVSCADSRVPLEIVFDQGFGDLFVIRVAGNVVAPSQVGSVEFAAERFGTRLVVVLGHSQCGAIQATVEALRNPGDPGSRNLLAIVDRIRPAVTPLVEAAPPDDPTLLDRAVRANIRASADHLRHGSEILENLVLGDGLRIVGAEYDLATGVVDFFDA